MLETDGFAARVQFAVFGPFKLRKESAVVLVEMGDTCAEGLTVCWDLDPSFSEHANFFMNQATAAKRSAGDARQTKGSGISAAGSTIERRIFQLGPPWSRQLFGHVWRECGESFSGCWS